MHERSNDDSRDQGTQVPRPAPQSQTMPMAQQAEPQIRIGQILLRRWKPALAAALIVIGIGAFITLTSKRVYEAHTMLVLVTSGGGAGGSADSLLGNLTALTTSRNADTQIEVLGSPDLLNEVFDTFPEEARTKAFGPLPKYYGEIKLPKWAYRFENTNETDVVDITGRAYDPKSASVLANRIAERYLNKNLLQNIQSAKKAQSYVDIVIEKTQEELRKATEAQADYQKKNGIATADPSTQAIEQNVMAMRQELVSAQSNLTQTQSQYQVARSQLAAAAPEIPGTKTMSINPEFSQVQTDLVSLETQLSQVSRQFKSDTPQVKRLRGQIQDDKDRLGQITQNLLTEEQRQSNPAVSQLLVDLATIAESQAAATARLNASEQALKDARAELDALPEVEMNFARLQENVNVLQMTFEDLKARHYQLQIEEQSGLPNGVVASYAHPPTVHSSPKISINMLVTFILALIAAIIAALWSESHDRTVHSSTPIETLTGLPVLAALPLATKGDFNDGGRLLIASVGVNSAFVEAVRLLRNSIAFSMPDRILKIITITSPGASEGKSTTAVNLAIALAMDGKRVLLVDVDLRRPSLHKWMGADREKGLTQAVSGRLTIPEVIQQSPYSSLDFVTSGPLPPNPSEFLNTAAFRSVIEKLRDMYDVIVLDAPPTTGLSDVQILSQISDGVLLVVSQDVTLKQHLLVSVRLLNMAGSPILGMVLNRAKEDAAGYGYYYYYYYYTDYNSDTEGTTKNKIRGRKGRK